MNHRSGKRNKKRPKISSPLMISSIFWNERDRKDAAPKLNLIHRYFYFDYFVQSAYNLNRFLIVY
ncbi:MAG: hypothetical protein HY036_06325 [Nitrospirae bacterium]|nr:hypothetical protein [Nitrospirota bacterium]MBI3352176.1 hypothetical protein [Nitrospirota bacterium]